jgi:hypothetical protein
MESERDARTVEELMAIDAALLDELRTWPRAALETAMVGAIVSCRMVDRQLNDLRRQLEDLGIPPCA